MRCVYCWFFLFLFLFVFRSFVLLPAGCRVGRQCVVRPGLVALRQARAARARAPRHANKQKNLFFRDVFQFSILISLFFFFSSSFFVFFLFLPFGFLPVGIAWPQRTRCAAPRGCSPTGRTGCAHTRASCCPWRRGCVTHTHSLSRSLCLSLSRPETFSLPCLASCLLFASCHACLVLQSRFNHMFLLSILPPRCSSSSCSAPSPSIFGVRLAHGAVAVRAHRRARRHSRAGVPRTTPGALSLSLSRAKIFLRDFFMDFFSVLPPVLLCFALPYAGLVRARVARRPALLGCRECERNADGHASGAGRTGALMLLGCLGVAVLGGWGGGCFCLYFSLTAPCRACLSIRRPCLDCRR